MRNSYKNTACGAQTGGKRSQKEGVGFNIKKSVQDFVCLFAFAFFV